ncbi:GntR family transcriptional regulator [Phaeovulum sp.]|uniref:GntR family transcriptional regulator n=1 Tax=Phaeovulum sp. TaxID=2934796 RepID=UPI0027313D4C|nr:GntR family transcriptional regulator [Phaeovulum sp.]MDP1668402.1 GntR family transcriptional regulator [Phaeovulum sp.]MDZ4120103.1 GntR family transcriptional regulator [Phaeovulum sp.]
MARTDARFRTAYNQTLDQLVGQTPGDPLPSELKLAEALKVSRTVVRAVLKRLAEGGIIGLDGRHKPLLRVTTEADRLPEREEYISLRELEGRFLDWVLRFDVPADTPLNVAQLAKQFSVPPHLLQEFLASLGQFGLVERRPRGGWRLLGFTADYAVELSEFRLLLEVNAMRTVTTLPETHPIWRELGRLEHDHLDLLARIDVHFRDFSRLDEQFHATINGVVSNRFVVDFQKVISLIFHYHYQWDKQLERRRNEAAIGEHCRIIAALRSRDPGAAEGAARAHLATSKETLLASLRVNRLG